MIKTISLSGAEATLTGLGGVYASVCNSGVDTVYASAKPDVVPGADGVQPIAPGSAIIIECNGTLHLFGTGEVTAVGTTHPIIFFAKAPASGGGGIDQGARDAINAHAGNTSIHLTAADVAGAVSNPNLLINSDFRCVINQRGQAEYIAGNSWGAPVYSVDQWIVMTDVEADLSAGTNKVTVNDDGTVTIAVANSYWTRLYQLFENPLNGRFTVTAKIKSATAGLRLDVITGDGAHISETTIGANLLDGAEQIITATADFADVSAIALNLRNDFGYGNATIEWVKLECGGASTLFSPPDPATEMAKCQRYYQIRSTGDIDPNDLRPTMAEITDIRQREDGTYEYIAELR